MRLKTEKAVNSNTLWALLIVLAASLTLSSLVSPMVGYVVVLAVYVLFVGVLVATDRFAIVYHWAIVPMVLLIWVVFALTTVSDLTKASVLRLGAFTVITGINLFVVPAVINRATIYNVLAYTAGAFVLIGLPTAFVDSYRLAGFTISPWHTDFQMLGVVFNNPVSIFDNPNHLSNFAAIGAAAAGASYIRSRAPLAIGLICLNTLGVILAGGRGALLALVVAGGLYIVYTLFGPITMTAFVGVGALAVVVSFGMVFGVIPGPNAITSVDLSGRRELWTAAYKAFLDRPVIGWGPGNDILVLAKYAEGHLNATHNSYLRLFLISGILGGGAYLVITISTIIIGLRNARSDTVFTFLLFVMFSIIQIFEGMTIFGLSLISVLGALFVGYTQSFGKACREGINAREYLTNFIRKWYHRMSHTGS